jgi:hypothetical protein
VFEQRIFSKDVLRKSVPFGAVVGSRSKLSNHAGEGGRLERLSKGYFPRLSSKNPCRLVLWLVREVSSKIICLPKGLITNKRVRGSLVNHMAHLLLDLRGKKQRTLI